MSTQGAFRLDGRSVIVTGASSGLGVHFAVACAGAGADVVICGRRSDRLPAHPESVGGVGGKGLAGAPAGPVHATEETPEHFARIIDVNLFGAYWMAQACGRVMRPGSSIVNVGSVLGLTTGGLPQAAYSASKAGLIGLTRA